MKLKHYLQYGLDHIINNLSLITSLGRERLLDQSLIRERKDLEKEYDIIDKAIRFIKDKSKDREKILRLIHSLRDISGSIALLETEAVLDDINLFEIKTFSMLSDKIRDIDYGIEELELKSLNNIVEKLDPEGLRLNQFYIYSAYSKELEEKRKEWEKSKKEGDEDKTRELYLESIEIENKIRERLTNEIRPYTQDLRNNLETIARLDIYLAKSSLFIEKNYKRPRFSSNNRIVHQNLVYPPLFDQMKEEKKEFQAISIEIGPEPILITGANMSGKTIILKSLALSQLMAGFGFFIASESSEIVLVEDVLIMIEDKQNEKKGLSSYSAEILNLDEFIQKAKRGRTYLVLIDELARTTNPLEGGAIVEAYLKIIRKTNSFSITTTHYSNIETKGKHLRIKGIDRDKLENLENTSIDIIQDLMDYSLVEVEDQEAPSEALNIAEILGVDKELINEARRSIKIK